MERIKKIKKIIYCCIDCGDKICRETALYHGGRCKHCANKGNRNYNFIDGKRKHIKNGYNCLEKCGNKVCQEGNRCYSCSGKERFKDTKNNPMSGKTLEEMHGKVCKCSFCKMKRGEIKGKNHPNFIEGLIRKYPRNFYNIRKIILERDNYQCQCCRITEKTHFKIYKFGLHVHHIDYNKLNNKEKNLITTCLTCNLEANKNKNYWFAFYTYIIKTKSYL